MKTTFLALALFVVSSTEAYNEAETYTKIVDLIAENDTSCITTSCNPDIKRCVTTEACGSQLLILTNSNSLPQAEIDAAAASLIGDDDGKPVLECGLCSCGSTIEKLFGADVYQIAQSAIPCPAPSDATISTASIVLSALAAYALF